MRKRNEVSLTYLVNKVYEGPVGVHRRAQHQGVDEHTDQRIEHSVTAAGDNQYEVAIMAAVDDAMVGVLNQVGTMERIPEGGTAIRSQAEADIASLKELADRVESMQAAAPKIVDHLAAPSPIQNVLDQLRQDEAARDELEPDSEVRRTLG